jgi:hypothetical protein
MKIHLQHSQTGIVKTAKYGFSWTTLFFGFFPALLRGDLKWASIMFIIALITIGFSWLIFPFFYNKIYIKELLEKGYKPADEGSRRFLVGKSIIADSN